MNLSDMANYVTTQVGLTDTDDIAAAQLFIRNWDEQLYNSYLWKDALVGIDYPFNPANPDNAQGVVVIPPIIDLVVGARVSASPGVWGNSLRIHGMEDYYRVDWDWFAQQGVPYEFAEMTPIWFNYYGNGGLQLINNNIGDSGAACEVTWYDANNVKHVQVAVPGSQFIPGADTIGEPPSQVAGTVPTALPVPVGQYIYQGNYNGAAPTFIPPTGVAIAFDTVTGQMFSYYSGAWH